MTFLHELLSVFSRLLNVLCGGMADMTFSARVHMDGWHKTEAFIDAVFWVIRREENHCATWFHEDVRRAAEIVAHAQQVKA